MTDELRQKLYDRLMKGAAEQSRGDKVILKVFEDMATAEIDTLAPIIDEALKAGQPDAERVAVNVLHHIDEMYPAMWTGVPKTARTSLRNTIKRELTRG